MSNASKSVAHPKSNASKSVAHQKSDAPKSVAHQKSIRSPRAGLVRHQKPWGVANSKPKGIRHSFYKQRQLQVRSWSYHPLSTTLKGDIETYET